MWHYVILSGRWIANDELRNGILNFDFDAFMTAVIKNLYEDCRVYLFLQGEVIAAFDMWTQIPDHPVRHGFQIKKLLPTS